MTLLKVPAAFLSAQEMHHLTGYVYPAYQIRWLQQKGIPHWVNAAGKPVVKRDFGTQRKELGAVR